MIYLALSYVLVVNVCRTITDYRRMYWAAIAGVFVQSLLSLKYLLRLPAESRGDLETLNEHGSAIGMNLHVHDDRPRPGISGHLVAGTRDFALAERARRCGST